MPRRKQTNKRIRLADAKYNNATLAEIINKIMYSGKKSTAQSVIYGALDIIEEKEKSDPIVVLEQALKNSTPLLEVKARRVGGATYQVPVEVDANRGRSLAIRWLIKSTRTRGGKSMSDKFASGIGGRYPHRERDRPRSALWPARFGAFAPVRFANCRDRERIPTFDSARNRPGR